MPDSREIAVYSSPEKERFELAQRQARAFAGSTLIPDHMRTVENCLAAMMMADEMGESRLAIIQNIFSVHGRPGWVTSFVIARANRSGKLIGPLRWRTLSREPLAVECYADLAAAPENDRRVSVELDLKTAVESGWTTYKKDGKTLTHARWATPLMQEQMLRWRTAAWLLRLYLPETMMGLPTKEEMEDLSDREMVDVTPPPPMPKLAEFTEAKEPPKRRGRTAPEPTEATPPDEPGIPLYELTTCDHKRITCTADTVEENMMAILAAAHHLGPDAIEAVCDNNEHIVKELGLISLSVELAQWRNIANAEREAAAEDPMPPAEKPPNPNPADRPRARPPAGVPPNSDGSAAVAAAAASPAQAASQEDANPYVLTPLYERDEKTIAYAVWWTGRFRDALYKAKTAGEVNEYLKSNREMIEGYYATLSPPAKIAAMKELTDILKEKARP
jgi:hypothetical protein